MYNSEDEDERTMRGSIAENESASFSPELSHEGASLNDVCTDGFDDLIHDWFGSVDVPLSSNAEQGRADFKSAATTPLCQGSPASTASATLLLLNIQAMYGWSNASMTALLR